MTQKKFLLYLASQSPRRKQILKKMKVRFRVVATRYREEKIRNTSPAVLAVHHACGKAKRAKLPKGARFVMGADTLIKCRKRILGKPRSRKEALRTLAFLSGRPHFVYTGVAILDRKMHRMLTGVSKTKVFIKRLSKKAIADYVDRIHTLDKAGAYAIQETPAIVRKIEGSYSNVMGLPEERVRKMLEEIKI